MSTATREIIRICEALPDDKRAEVAEFARFLLLRKEHPDDAAWEHIIADDRTLPQLEASARAAAAEGDELLDPKRL
jgi:hypothetical protein